MSSSLSLGELVTTFGADVDPLLRAAESASKALNDFARVASSSSSEVTSSLQRVERQTTSLTGQLKGFGAALAGLGIAKAVSDVTMLAARYETLGVTMGVVGNNAGKTQADMDALTRSLEKTGISMTESRNNLVRMTQAHLDLSKATELARIAQDAAVIGNMNSSEAFSHMIYGIQTAQVEVLRTIGINVNFENSYKSLAAQLGKSKDALTEQEKAQARMNVVLEAGRAIAGSYEAAMDTVGKQLTSLARYSEDASVKLGEVFQPAFAEIIRQITNELKSLNQYLDTNKATVAVWGQTFLEWLINIEAEIIRFAMFLDKVGGSLTALGYDLVQLAKWVPGYALATGMFPDVNKLDESLKGMNDHYKQRYEENEKLMESHAQRLLDIQAKNDPAAIAAQQADNYAKEQNRIAQATGQTVDAFKAAEKAWNDKSKAMDAYSTSKDPIVTQIRHLQEYENALKSSTTYQMLAVAKGSDVADSWLKQMVSAEKAATSTKTLESAAKKYDDTLSKLHADMAQATAYESYDAKIVKLDTQFAQFTKTLGATNPELKTWYDTMKQRLDTDAWEKGQEALKGIADQMAQLTMSAADYEKYKLDEWYSKEAQTARNAGYATEEYRQALDGLKDAKLGVINLKEAMDDNWGLGSEELWMPLSAKKDIEDIRIAYENIGKTAADIARNDLQRWYEQQKNINGLTDEQLKMLDEVYKDKLKKIENKNDDLAKAFEDVWKNTVNNIQRTFSDTFYNMLDGQINSWSDFCDSMINIFKRMLAELAAAWLMNGIKSWLSGSDGGFSLASLFGSSGSTSASSGSSSNGGSAVGSVISLASALKTLKSAVEFVAHPLDSIAGWGESITSAFSDLATTIHLATTEVSYSTAAMEDAMLASEGLSTTTSTSAAALTESAAAAASYGAEISYSTVALEDAMLAQEGYAAAASSATTATAATSEATAAATTSLGAYVSALGYVGAAWSAAMWAWGGGLDSLLGESERSIDILYKAEKGYEGYANISAKTRAELKANILELQGWEDASSKTYAQLKAQYGNIVDASASTVDSLDQMIERIQLWQQIMQGGNYLTEFWSDTDWAAAESDLGALMEQYSTLIHSLGLTDESIKALQDVVIPVDAPDSIAVTVSYGDLTAGRATGGPVAGGHPYIVGELGPELFVPAAPGHILTASDTQRLMAAGVQGFASGTQKLPWYEDPYTHSSGTTEVELWEGLYEKTLEYLDILNGVEDKLAGINKYYEEQIEKAQELGVTEDELNQIYEMQSAAVAKVAQDWAKDYDAYVSKMLGLNTDLGDSLAEVTSFYETAIASAIALGQSQDKIDQMWAEEAAIKAKILADWSKDEMDYYNQAMGNNTELGDKLREIQEHYKKAAQEAAAAGATAEQLAGLWQAAAEVAKKAADDYYKSMQDTIDSLTRGDTLDDQLRSTMSDIVSQFTEFYKNIMADTTLSESDRAQKLIDLANSYNAAMANAVNKIIKNILSQFDDINEQIAKYNWQLANPSGTGSQYVASKISTLYGTMSSDPAKMTLDNINQLGSLLVDWYKAAVSEAESKAQELADAYNTEIKLHRQASDSIKNLVESINDSISNLKYSQYNLALPQAKAVASQDDYAKLRAKAFSSSATIDDVKAFQSFTNTYLEQMQSAYKSSDKYLASYNQVMADLEALKSQVQTTSFENNVVESLRSIDDGLKKMEDFLDLTEINSAFQEAQKAIEYMISQLTGSTTTTVTGTLTLTVSFSSTDPTTKAVAEWIAGTLTVPADLTIRLKFDAEDDITMAVAQWAAGELTVSPVLTLKSTFDTTDPINQAVAQWVSGALTVSPVLTLKSVFDQTDTVNKAVAQWVAGILKVSPILTLKTAFDTTDPATTAVAQWVAGTLKVSPVLTLKMTLDLSDATTKALVQWIAGGSVTKNIQTIVSDPSGYRAKSVNAYGSVSPGQELGYHNTANGPLYSAFSFSGRSPGEMLFDIAYNTYQTASALGKTGYFAEGGIATGPITGYPAMLHGTELIVPLNNPKEARSVSASSESDPEVKALLRELVAATKAGKTIVIDGKPIAAIADRAVTERINRGMIADGRRLYN